MVFKQQTQTMKKHLLLFLLIFTFSKQIAQVVFCPPGAEWRVMWTGGMSSQNIYNRTITYARDTVISSVSYKVIQQQSFYPEPCANINSQISVIKQSGDTVFFRNANSSHTWQILYNFAATAGQSWTTAIRSSTSAVDVHTVTVQSVNTVTINNFPLRTMFVSVNFFQVYNSYVSTYSMTIIERLGSDYLFNFRNQMSGGCDVGVFLSGLCYRDNAFGLTQYNAARSCDFTNVGVREYETINTSIKLYPNPASTYLIVDMDTWKGTYTIKIQNSMGQFVDGKITATGSTVQLNVETLPEGIYLLQIFDGTELKGVKKFRKEGR